MLVLGYSYSNTKGEHMPGTKYAISILDADKFHDFISYIRREYGREAIFEPLDFNRTKPWPFKAPFDISLVEDNEYGAIVEVGPTTEGDEEYAQEEFRRYMSMFNIYAQRRGD
jgi:hypothetical protein